MKTKPSRSKRPFVFMNAAMTADGKIATSNHVVSSFGSKRDLEAATHGKSIDSATVSANTACA